MIIIKTVNWEISERRINQLAVSRKGQLNPSQGQQRGKKAVVSNQPNIIHFSD